MGYVPASPALYYFRIPISSLVTAATAIVEKHYVSATFITPTSLINNLFVKRLLIHSPPALLLCSFPYVVGIALLLLASMMPLHLLLHHYSTILASEDLPTYILLR